MINWLKSLFETRQVKRKYVRLSNEEEKNLVTDFMINKMSRRDISIKYNISYSNTCRIIRDNSRIQR